MNLRFQIRTITGVSLEGIEVLVKVFHLVETGAAEIELTLGAFPSHSNNFWYITKMAGSVLVFHSCGSIVNNLYTYIRNQINNELISCIIGKCSFCTY